MPDYELPERRVPTSWQQDLEGLKQELQAPAPRRRRPLFPVLVLLLGAAGGGFLLLGRSGGPDARPTAAGVSEQADAEEEALLPSGRRRSTIPEHVTGVVDDEVPGHIPAASGINVCALVDVDEVDEALDDVVTSEHPGKREGPNDPMGHCLWPLTKQMNLHIGVVTEAGVRLDGDPDYSLAASWFGRERESGEVECSTASATRPIGMGDRAR